MIECSSSITLDWQIDWFIDWLIDWLMDGLTDWQARVQTPQQQAGCYIQEINLK